jgi:hypothetical protein
VLENHLAVYQTDDEISGDIFAGRSSKNNRAIKRIIKEKQNEINEQFATIQKKAEKLYKVPSARSISPVAQLKGMLIK